ncbi:H-NS family nucleoid-associated regulatory protein [Paracoccus aestuariivivens]|uniref:H-NS histone family protein n=1 Tax=Paracoccus aestuariivivens TaxID=1820333 RepID=A0A6L6JDJ5_9RHOB|nr:H-NS histone family protein [Paracoccus aestuariivivens]MTH78234.1 H-NS histone family protein [Paracoccus aestuariivivens]
MELDLEKLSLRELRDIRNKVEKAISTFEDRRKREALAAVENAAREFGFTFADLANAKPTRGKVAAKYADPSNPESTWTGRGRKPRWVVDALDAGKALEDLEI